MHRVTNIQFDQEERAVFAKVTRWGGLLDESEGQPEALYSDARGLVGILRRLETRNPPGFTALDLQRARTVLTAIHAVAKERYEWWVATMAVAPEESEENALVAKPRQMSQVIAEARAEAMRDVALALDLVDLAEQLVTAPIDERADA